MTVHMVGNAHIDPVWLWRWQDGYAEVKATFRSALDRMREFPGFIFTCAGALYYRWIEESDPAMFREIRARVDEGRWVIVGGWLIQPDCNLPCGESFVRHSLYGQRWFLSRFGRRAVVAYNVDSFGHAASLPQVLAGSGMPYYVMMRPQEHEKELPGSLFWWEGLDGTRVLTYRIPINYASWWGSEDPVRQKALDVEAMARSQGTDMMCFYGVGNHGGGPTTNSLRAITELQAGAEPAGHGPFPFSTPETLFRAMQEKGPSLPVVKGELQHHARGCYSAHAETKALNRKAEHRVLAAEKLASLAHGVLGAPYPAAEIGQAWEKVLFNQFHDVLGGACIPEAYEDVREFYGQALSQSGEALNRSAQALSWAIDTALPGSPPLSRDKDWLLWESGDNGSPVVVFNSLSWPVDARVRVNRKAASVTDDARRPLPLQLVRASRTHEGPEDAVFIGRVPALGYATFWIYRDKAQPASPASAVSVPAPGVMDNGLLRVDVDQVSGLISRILDRRTGTEVLRSPSAVPIVMDESMHDTWAHEASSFRVEAGRFRAEAVTVLDAGPVVARIRATSRYGASTLRQDFTLHAGSPVLEVHCRLTWLEKQRMLKLAFDALLEDPVATWEIPYGALQRPPNGEEEPGQQWIDVSGTAPGAQRPGAQPGARAAGARGPAAPPIGLALLNTGKYSFDILGSEMRMTVARSPVAADTNGVRDESCEYLDQGVQDFSYALLPHAGDWRSAGVVRAALELNSPPFRVLETYHPGPLGRSLEGIRVSAPQIVATALKRAEDGEGYILRCYDSAGQGARADITLPFLGRAWTAVFAPWQVRTFRIPDDAGQPVRAAGMVELKEDDHDA